jgi:hypothetical protein
LILQKYHFRHGWFFSFCGQDLYQKLSNLPYIGNITAFGRFLGCSGAAHLGEKPDTYPHPDDPDMESIRFS